MYRGLRSFLFLLAGVVCAGMVAGNAYGKSTVLGFVQVGAEGTWRLTNTRSVKESAEKAGFNLVFKEGSTNFSNQIEEMRELILTGVDVLAFSPSQVDGWDEILQEAQDAGIPVIVLDRAIEVSDPDLYVTHIGSDMLDEGRRAGKWLLNYMKSQGKTGEVSVAVLEGVAGSTPAVHRDQGFREVLSADSNYKIVATKPADFSFAKGKEVMAEFLKKTGGNIDVVFAHNDDMALGAIEAIEESGKVPGKDVVIIGVDAIKKAFEAIIAGKMNATIECSPLLGPQLVDAVNDLVAGKPVDKRIVTIEKDYDQTNAAAELKNRTY